VGAAEAQAVVDLAQHGDQVVDRSAVLAAVSWTRNGRLEVPEVV
jgi:hypothetical protein